MLEKMGDTSDEKWYTRLDRLMTEHASQSTVKREEKPSKGSKKVEKAPTPMSLHELFNKAEKAFDEMRSRRRKIDSDSLTKRVLQSGTLSDKIAAMALAIGDEPLQSLEDLGRLTSMCGSKGRREATLAMDAYRDLLLDVLLPPNRRLNVLKSSLESIANRETVSDEILGLMKFEDVLKSSMWEFVKSVERACKDEIIHHKIAAMKRAADLLQERPEQERFLLSLLCSKMGDPDVKASGQASHLLRRVANAHPQMRVTMVAELESSILSASASEAYVYEAVIFLNQTILRQGDSELADRLIDIYFALFEKNLQKIESVPAQMLKSTPSKKSKKKNKTLTQTVVGAKQGVNSKLMAALLTGVNRALPFCESQTASHKAKFTERCEQLYRLAKDTETFAIAVQVLSLLFKLDADRTRFYQLLSKRIQDPALLDGKKTAFLNLVYRAFKADTDRVRLVSNVKLLLSVALKSTAAFSAATLFLLSNLVLSQKFLFVDLLGEETVNRKHDNDADLSAEKQSTQAPSAASLGNVIGANEQKKDKVNQSALAPVTTVAWELELFRTHHHPTVQAFARRILDREPIEYDGDPLHDFSLATFLDRFVYRNPKEKRLQNDGSKAFGLKGREQRLGAKAAHNMPVNSESFHQRYSGHSAKIGEETDRFFYRYFDNLKKQGVHLAQGVAAGRDVDLEAMEDAFADSLVDDLLKKSAGGQDADVDDEDFLAELGTPGGEDEDDEDDIDLDEEIDIDEAAFESDDDEHEDADDMALGGDDDSDDDGDTDDEENTGKKGKYSLYADAEDFAGLLDNPNDDETAEKAKWQSKKKKGEKNVKPIPKSSKPATQPKKKQRRNS